MILNVGCGDDLYGDIRVDIIKTRATNVLCDIESGLPFRSEIFEQVYAKFILEHLRNPGNVLREIQRVLKKGGILIIKTDNASCIGWHITGLKFLGVHTWEHDKYSFQLNPSDMHYALFLPGHVVNHLKLLGFKIYKIEYFWGESLINRGWFKRFLELISNFPPLKKYVLPHFMVIAIKW